LQAGCHPKEVIARLSEDLLAHYAGRPLIDPYDIYQHLMDYWAGTMQDDGYLIAADGWKAEPYRVVETDKKGREKDKGWACDLVPKALIVARYYAEEQVALDRLAAELERVGAERAELEEEHGGEDAAFSGFEKINAANVKDRIHEIGADPDGADELRVLKAWLALMAEESALKRKLKDAEAALDAKAYARYSKLAEDEIKALVVDDKWLAALDATIHGEMDRVSQQLTRRVKELAERYETPLARLSETVEALSARVANHLKKMGFSW
jgi:type I restriction enzyme M protein